MGQSTGPNVHPVVLACGIAFDDNDEAREGVHEHNGRFISARNVAHLIEILSKEQRRVCAVTKGVKILNDGAREVLHWKTYSDIRGERAC